MSQATVTNVTNPYFSFFLEVHYILRNIESSEKISRVESEEFQRNRDKDARSRRAPMREVSTVTPGWKLIIVELWNQKTNSG